MGWWKSRSLRLILNLYPPYLGAGIRVNHIAADFSVIDVQMGLHFWNRNYVGTHFGGSLYAMVDPFLMLILIEQLGPAYVVWDKSAEIRFRRPGQGTVRAHFEIPRERVEEIRRAADADGKVEPHFTASVLDQQGQIVAEVDKLLYVRKKQG
jgi:hypothetical protein